MSRNRSEIAAEFTWNLNDIFTSWEQWDAARALLESRIEEYASLKGTLAQGEHQILKAFQLNDDLGKLAYTVYFYPSLRHDEDQRDNSERAPPASAGAHGALAGSDGLVQSGIADNSH